VLDRNGSVPLLPNDLGWKDTVMVNPSDMVNILIKFDKYDGMYLVHCHNLEHEDHGMMSNFVVENAGGVDKDSATNSELSIYPNPAIDRATVQLAEGDSNKELSVYDMTGKNVLKKIIPSGSQDLQLNLSSLAIGNYRIELNGRSAALTIVR
jgi:hypothetical protein